MPVGITKSIRVNGADIDVSESGSAKSFRLVHDGSSVLSFFEGQGVTSTKYQLFYGTVQECLNEISSKGLTESNQFVSQMIFPKLRVARLDARQLALLITELSGPSVLASIDEAIASVGGVK